MPSILVVGFLGAGKSALAVRLREAIPGCNVVEGDGRADPTGSHAGPVVAVADAANLVACLDDPLVAPLVAAQIGAAGLVLLTRTDLVPAGPALSALAGITDAPIIEVPPGPLPAGLGARIAALPACRQRPASGGPAFAEWRYAGPASVRESALHTLVSARPSGLYRLSGLVRSGRQGYELELAGRLRQLRPVPIPPETALVAIGPRGRFRPDEMALRFSEAVASAGWLAGLFGHR